MTLSEDVLRFIDARELELVAGKQAAENMAGSYMETLRSTQATLTTTQERLAEVLTRNAELVARNAELEGASKWVRIPADLTSAAGWTVQDRSSGTQSNDASVNLKENTLFTPAGLRILGTELKTAINSRYFGSGDVLGKHISVPNYFRAEVDAILPAVPGSWPCPLWFRPLAGPTLNDGEIDVVETWPHDWAAGAKAWAAIHPEYTSTVGAKKANAGRLYSELPNPDPGVKHTYAVEKTKQRIAFWVDGVLVYDWNTATFNDNVRAWWDRIMELPTRTWYPRITLQVGGTQTGGYPKRPWAGCEMLVTDLRIYRPA